jgi:hypothetical protein
MSAAAAAAPHSMSVFPAVFPAAAAAPPRRAAFNPTVIDSAQQKLSSVALQMFSNLDTRLRDQLHQTKSDALRFDFGIQDYFMVALADISSDPMTTYQVVDEALWQVLHMSATVAARHDSAVQDRVDKTTAAVLSALYPHKPMMTLTTQNHTANRASLLYRCVRETQHVFGPETLAMIASRYDQCFREAELLDHAAMDLFEKRYHHKVLDGYSLRTSRPPPYREAAV